ncbi:ABC transporter ATP-binding protein [Bizionia sediminis]|uniref:ABC transporter ATP-binding protein n=1 Tax=Bizionia sediminis TaxID=1737064 RepID=A0ABW5KQJ5_9FLAO
MNKNTKPTIIETKNLTIGYTSKKSTTVVCKNINMSLQKGQLIGLVGANGIGKSTFLRTLTRVQPQISGSIFLDKKLLDTYSNSQLAKTMSVVLTEQIASKNLSVFEVVALGRQPYTNWLGKLSETDMRMVNLALEQTNIGALKNKKCYELSDGQLQKVMIARALAQDTDLIILDEPTTHLDMYHKAYILKLLQKLVKETNKTILFSSHEIDLAIQLCDTMVVLTNNKVITDAPCNLISAKVFEALFPSDLIAFDTKTGSFRVKK